VLELIRRGLALLTLIIRGVVGTNTSWCSVVGNSWCNNTHNSHWYVLGLTFDREIYLSWGHLLFFSVLPCYWLCRALQYITTSPFRILPNSPFRITASFRMVLAVSGTELNVFKPTRAVYCYDKLCCAEPMKCCFSSSGAYLVCTEFPEKS